MTQIVGQWLIQYVEKNYWTEMEKSDWLILVISPLK